MRVISGKFRGLNLAEFQGDDIRPTADRVKESLFNILAPRISGATVLDLFCGSGSLGIECLSRGAAHAAFNDVAASSVDLLNKNLAKLKGENSYSVTKFDYATYLKSCSAPFDIIFIDPPYRYDYGIIALQLIAERGLLNDGGVAIYERDRSFVGEIAGLEMYDERKYGKTYLTFFKRVL